jgi:hypothetical protein
MAPAASGAAAGLRAPIVRRSAARHSNRRLKIFGQNEAGVFTPIRG